MEGRDTLSEEAATVFAADIPDLDFELEDGQRLGDVLDDAQKKLVIDSVVLRCAQFVVSAAPGARSSDGGYNKALVLAESNMRRLQAERLVTDFELESLRNEYFGPKRIEEIDEAFAIYIEPFHEKIRTAMAETDNSDIE
mgnify:CR=1 FL=1